MKLKDCQEGMSVKFTGFINSMAYLNDMRFIITHIDPTTPHFSLTVCNANGIEKRCSPDEIEPWTGDNEVVNNKATEHVT